MAGDDEPSGEAGGGLWRGVGLLKRDAGTAVADGGALGDVMVCPQTGQGPVTPAIWAGTVSTVLHALHWNCSTSGVMKESEGISQE